LDLTRAGSRALPPAFPRTSGRFEPTDLVDLGFPEMHLVVSVTGTAY
jgi:hypothetical protein